VKKFFRNYAAAFAQLEGFGNYAPVLVPFSEKVDPASLQGAFVYVQREGARWRRGPAANVEVPDDAILEADGKFFALVQPPEPLSPDATWYLALLKGPTTAAGAPLTRGVDFHEAASDAFALPVAGVAAALQKEPSDVLFAMELRPADVRRELTRIFQWALQESRPRVVIPPRSGDALQGVYLNDGTVDELTTFERFWRGGAVKGHASIGAVVLGQFASREFRVDGVFDPQRVENPASAPEAMLDFVLVVPKSAFVPSGDGGPPRFRNALPVVIGQHGINGRNSVVRGSDDSFCMKMGELFASHGLACLGIDATGHGNRGRITDFFSVADLRKARDNFRQTYADLLNLASALPQFDFNGDGMRDFEDVPRFFGQSLGGIMGTAYVALDPRVQSAVLNVPGVGLTSILMSEHTRDMAGVLIAAESGIDYGSDEYNAMFPLMRTVAQL
ncbi:MAG: hypothetical protein ACK4N5_21865, partial [Myxococcales bacterium]